MNIKADARYNGIVAPGSQLYETQTGTLGYQVMLECADGSTSFVIWLTQKNRERAKKHFEVLGVDPARLKDPGYIEYQLGLDIEGREVSFQDQGRGVQRQAEREGRLDREEVGPKPIAERRPFFRRYHWRWRNSW